jgi:hypothetical protein
MPHPTLWVNLSSGLSCLRPWCLMSHAHDSQCLPCSREEALRDHYFAGFFSSHIPCKQNDPRLVYTQLCSRTVASAEYVKPHVSPAWRCCPVYQLAIGACPGPQNLFLCWKCPSTLCHLKGLSHEIFRPVFWPVWMHLGLTVNHLRF